MCMKKRPKVGIFDSGIGGLSVLKACLTVFPEGQYYYFGDNEHAPYGSRSPEEITRYTEHAMHTFEKRGVSVAVIACNTATAVCIDEMRKKFSFPIVGVEPAVGQAVKQHKNILVLATPRTAESDRLKRLLARFPYAEFTVCGLPHLAAAIEAYFHDGEGLTISDHFAKIPCDAVVLGCTHYALISEKIAEYLGVPVYDGAEGTARRVKFLLNVGTADHLDHGVFFGNKSHISVVFLGKSKHMNEKLFKSNICSQYF